MVSNEINSWEQYLTNEDYVYLVQYIENIKNGISNDKMIILAGPGRSGKSTLKKNITSYLGDEMCGVYCMSGDIIYDETIKPLGFFNGIDEISKSKKNNQAIINFIKYKQSFIADTNNIERVNNKLLEHSKIIMMTHIF
jgi:adenylylsulfate kinase-like enzyme